MDQATCIDFNFCDMANFRQDTTHTAPDEKQYSIQNVIMPMLIKESLKFAINAKRKSKGLDELRVEPRKVKPDRLTPEEEEKRSRRRERNRVAAAKCRNKKREKASVLETETRQLEETNAKLKADVARLEAEKKHLSEALQSHLLYCMIQPPSPCANSPLIPATAVDHAIATPYMSVTDTTAFSQPLMTSMY
ncbi:cyclic AMP-dependent transcription factor ATF-3-like isoform X2 [Ptychodera flava]